MELDSWLVCSQNSFQITMTETLIKTEFNKRIRGRSRPKISFIKEY